MTTIAQTQEARAGSMQNGVQPPLPFAEPGLACLNSAFDSDLPPAAFTQLEEAFRAFNEATASFTRQYSYLEKRISDLNVELEEANTRLRQKLEENERMQGYLSTLLECLPIGVVGADRQGGVCSVNRRAAEILECDRLDVSRMSILDLLIPANTPLRSKEERDYEDPLEILSLAVSSGLTTEQALEMDIERARDGRRRTLSIRIVPTGAREGESEPDLLTPLFNSVREVAAVFLVEDVTDVRRLEQQATRNNRLTAMGEIAINVAHEIRNPLGSIELFASMLHRDLADDPTNGPLAGHICTGVRVLDHIVSNILQFARPQRLCCSAFDLNDLIDETLLFSEHALRQKRIRIERQLGASGTQLQENKPRISVPLWADAELLKQMFLNLFLNAIQATPEEGLLGVRCIPNCKSVEIQIWDSGPGFTPEALGKIFDPFFTTRRKGTGLGLTIVHNIVSSHHGSIEAENRPEGGALFSIVLPMKTPVRSAQCLAAGTATQQPVRAMRVRPGKSAA
jgi:signal transduction histidine kinase